MRRVILMIFAMFAASACENVDMHMHDQLHYSRQEFPRKYQPVGSIPAKGFRASYADVDGVTLEPPMKLTAEVSQKGQKLYDIYCAVCHAADGKVTGAPPSEKFDVTPFDITQDSTKELTDGEIFVKILASATVMPKYRNELTDEEAWEVVAYVRHLQGAY